MTAGDPSLVEIYAAENLIEADAVCALLQDAGIAARVVGETLQVNAGAIPYSQAAPRIWTRADDATAARRVIDDWRAEQRQRRPQPRRASSQFSLRMVFIVTGIIAFLLAYFIAIAGKDEQSMMIVSLLAHVLFLALLIAAYWRKRGARRLSDDDENDE